MEDIDNPYGEIQRHVTNKFMQIGSVTGFCIGQIMGLYRARKYRTNDTFKSAAHLSARKCRNWWIGSGIASLPFCQFYIEAKQYSPRYYLFLLFLVCFIFFRCCF